MMLVYAKTSEMIIEDNGKCTIYEYFVKGEDHKIT